jgi:hypothetical protein
MLRVKAETAIVDLFIRVKLIAGGSTSLSLIKSTVLLARELKRLQKTQGVKGLALFLKSSSVALQQSCSGYVIKDFTKVGPRISRTSSGLPRIIPSSHRLIIKNKRPGYLILIRFYLSIFYLYRVLEFKGKVKLNTITDPGKPFDIERFNIWIELFNRLMIRNRAKLLDPISFMKSKAAQFAIFKSSPFTSTISHSPFNSDVNLTGLFSTHVVSLLDATRSIYSSHLYPIIQQFSTFYFEKLNKYFKMNIGLKRLEEMTKILFGENLPYKNF